VALIQTNYKEVREIYIFAFVLMVQALPFVAAVAIALWERSRINDFEVLEGYRTAFATLARRTRIAKVTRSVAPQQIAAKQPELTQ
jgi:hypothetical protein